MWLQRLFHLFMMVFLHALVFAASGALVVLVVARRVIYLTTETGWLIFGLAGLCGTAAFLYLMKRKMPPMR